jgi:PAS domain S-box-containing protein
MKVELPESESLRLESLLAYEVLDTDAERQFDDLTELASRICSTPIALISLVDADRQWFKSKIGLEVDETPREWSFCAHAILDDKTLIVTNAMEDARFTDNPLVTDDPRIRFYAGAPLCTPTGYAIGSLCVIDTVPRNLTKEQRESLELLARQVVSQLELRHKVAALETSQQRIESLRDEAVRSSQELNRLNQSLRESAAIHRALIDQSNNFIGLMSLDGTLIDANRTALAAAGIERGEALGKPFWETPWWNHSAELQERLKQSVAQVSQGSADKFEATHLTGDHQQVDVDFSLKPVKDDDGKTIYLIPEGQDITLHKQREQQLQQVCDRVDNSNRELEQFAYVASHDLQEPLRKIASYCQLLKEEQSHRLNDDGREYLDVSIDAAKRLQLLIRDLLAFARVNTHGKEPAATQANDSVRGAIANLEVAIEDRNAVVTVDPLPCVMADTGQLMHLFQNLICNAIKYCRTPVPRVHIGGRDLGSQFEFYVEDNGIGIEPKFQERIFHIFQRLHNRREYSGTGIGLALCKRIVERLGGEIWVESTQGAGSTFHFTLNKPQEGHDVCNMRAEPLAAAN